MSKIKITVFIPVYNMVNTIERAILSVLDQDYENKELIVLDGGSTDGTVEIIKRHLHRIAYFTSGPDGGSSKAIATNLVHATGEIVGMIGADDWYNPGALSAVAKTYEETHADVVYGDSMRIDPDGQREWISYAKVNLESMYVDCAIATTASFVKRNLLAEHYDHYFKEHAGTLKMATDYYLWLRLYHAGRRFVYIQSEMPITNFSLTGISNSRIYLGLVETKIAMEMAIGLENDQNRKYYQEFERRFSSYAVSYYPQVIGKDRLCEVIYDVAGKKADIILFGAGKIGEKFSIFLQSYGCNIRFVADNYPEHTDGFCAGIPVCPAKRLLTEQDAILLISTVNYEKEIRKQVQEMNLDPSITVLPNAGFCFEIYKRLGRDILDEAWEKGTIQ